MKSLQKFILLFVLCLSGIMTLSSCSKDDPGSNTPSASNLAKGKSTISFDYSGAQSGTFTSAELVSSAINNGTYGNISGGTTTLPIRLVLCLLENSLAPGSHTLSSLSSSATTSFSFTQDSNNWAAYAGDNFTIVIVKNDGALVEATFSGTLKNDVDGSTINVTNGKMAAKY